jgi:hypothetical protein
MARPYLGEPQLSEGVSGKLLGPWQRFDTMHYLRIARQGYESVADSVFPPVYPLGMALIGFLFSDFLPVGVGNLLGGLLFSNLACIGLLILLYKITAEEMDEGAARKTVLFLAVFPTSFFLLAGYTESIFILLALGSFWSARKGRFWLAGLLGFVAALTRLTGWVLVVPLAYEYYRQFIADEERPFSIQAIFSKVQGRSLVYLPAIFLPPLGLIIFYLIREVLGLPPIGPVYENYWLQTIGIPGQDIITVVERMLTGRARLTHIFDFFCTFLLIGTMILAIRRLGPSFGIYSAAFLFFMFLPASSQKPLYSFARYSLAFFPTFMVLAGMAKNPWVNRLIFYTSVALLLFFSGQFFVWGWVA